MENGRKGHEDDAEAPRLSPSIMHGLLRAGTSGTTRALRNWEPPTVEMIQRALPQYEISAFIARGGMGAVYKGVQTSLGRTVAVKILPQDIVDDELDYAGRFKREARSMAALSHPNIVAVHEAGETAEGLLYFAMDFIDGTDVAQMMAKRGRLPPAEALRITADVCAALECAHAHGIIHRDIKPSNVLINEQGVVKVADFGLAKIIETDDGQTHSVVAVGTPDFLAPEAHLPGIVLDQRADIYSAGVMLYEMLTGKVPRGRFDPPSGEVAGLDARLDAITDKAMRTDREKRYASAAQMRAALANVAVPARLWSRARRPRLATAATVVLALAGAAFWTTRAPKNKDAVISRPLARGPYWSRMPTKDEKKLAFTNTLGMKFVPVPGTDVLFCVHETRKVDYAAYAAENPGIDMGWDEPKPYKNVPVSDASDHPVVQVSLHDAQGFCAWLSKKEGRMYRLPTDHEWSCAAGIGEGEDEQALPVDRGGQFTRVFAWGTEWPPPLGAGNIGDETLKRITGQEPVITGYDDGFATTAPVMSFPPNALGIHDMAGNVWEVCSDWFDSQHKYVVGRGSSFDNGNPDAQSAYVAASVRNPRPPELRNVNSGIRIVAEKTLARNAPPVSNAR